MVLNLLTVVYVAILATDCYKGLEVKSMTYGKNLVMWRKMKFVVDWVNLSINYVSSNIKHGKYHQGGNLELNVFHGKLSQDWRRGTLQLCLRAECWS